MKNSLSLVRPVLAALLAACVLLQLALAPPARAVDVEQLYRGSAAVSSRGDEAERQRAFAPALREVLLKVSGKPDALEHPALRAALSNPQALVASWGYRTQPGEDGAERIELEVLFYESEIQALLARADLAFWPRNRPETLVWLVLQDEFGERELVGSASNVPLARGLREQARKRGLPVLMPLLDLEDRRSLDPDQVWDLDLEAVRAASRRYGSESILVIRAFSALGGERFGEARYLFRERVLARELYGNELAGFLDTALVMATQELSDYYGVLLSGTSSSLPVTLRVEGIATPRAYAGLLRYLEELADVQRYAIRSVDGEQVLLELVTGGQIRQLVESIALENTLQALSGPVREGEGVMMQYRWNGAGSR